MSVLRIAGVLLLVAVIGGCAAARTAEARTLKTGAISVIRFSAGPCFGACPVYSVEVTPNGPVRFDGKNFTRRNGVHMLPANPTLFAALRRAIERNEVGLRPENLTPEAKECAPVATDHPSYQFSWRRNGREITRTFYAGCHGAAGDAYRRLVRDFESALKAAGIPGETTPAPAPEP